jgi:hypothetical protein
MYISFFLSVLYFIVSKLTLFQYFSYLLWHYKALQANLDTAYHLLYLYWNVWVWKFHTLGSLPLPLALCYIWADKGGYFQGYEISDMTSLVLGEMFEGDSANTFAGKFPLMLMGSWAQTRKWWPPSVWAELLKVFTLMCISMLFLLRNFTWKYQSPTDPTVISLA